MASSALFSFFALNSVNQLKRSARFVLTDFKVVLILSLFFLLHLLQLLAGLQSILIYLKAPAACFI
jgi:hypothetical protein